MAEQNIAMEMPQWFFRIAVLILVLVVIMAGISMFLSREIDVKEYESRLITYKIYSCLSDNNHFGVIDSSKINNIENCIGLKDIQLNIQFLDLDENILNEKKLNEDKFNVNWPLCNVKTENEKLYCYSKRDYLIMDNKPIIFDFKIILSQQEDSGFFKRGFI